MALALSSALYGLVRKLVRGIGAVAGLTVETALLSPLALGYLVWAHERGTLCLPLGIAASRRPARARGPRHRHPAAVLRGAPSRGCRSSLGFLQYVSPSMQFPLAVLVYGEPFTLAQAGAFGLIWLALALFAAHSLRRVRRRAW